MQASDIKCFILRPPDQPLPGVKKVAILKFKGANGDLVMDHLTTSLLQKGRGITQVNGGGFFSGKKDGRTYLNGAHTDIFTLIDRDQLDQVLKEQRLGASGLVDENQAASIGKLLGADAIITGDLSATPKLDHGTQDQYNPSTKTTTTVATTTRTVIVHVNMKIISVTTGAIMATKEATSTKSDLVSGDGTQPRSEKDLTDDALKELCDNQLGDCIAPRFIYNKFDLKDIDDKDYHDKANKAGDAAGDGKLDDAFLVYAGIVKDDPYDDQALYNLGVLNEVVGNYKDALDYYTKAVSIRKDDDYQRAMEHCKQSNSFRMTLEQIGDTLRPHAYVVSNSQTSSGNAAKITLAGDAGNRINMREKPDENSHAVARLPGGIELDVVEKAGDWFKVKTFDGKIGYIKKDDVK
ncbi:MAG TPA: CsgG/HfaB family protein [Bacteroidota bacterium]|nr:CsgG/HfaB family protein [Bacteroidota bacterium]